jgi:hypothetical protein
MAVAFAFGQPRKAILLVAGEESGGSQKRLYDPLIAKAAFRFHAHPECLKTAETGK